MKHADLDDHAGLRQARMLWAQNRRGEALALFERVVAMRPTSILARVDAARALGAMYLHERAENHLTQALAMGASSAAVQYLAGQTYRLMRRHDRAVECLREATLLYPAHAEAHLELAILLERRGDLEGAMEHCRQRLRLAPQDAEGRFVRGRVLRRRGDLDEAESALNEAIATPGHELTRSRGLSELARLLDERGRVDEAWQTMLRGKALLRPQALPHIRRRDAMLPPLVRLGEQTTGEHFARWREVARSMPAPSPRPILLTGMPRSGTTLLARLLGARSGVAVADEFDLFPQFLLPMLLGRTEPDALEPGVLDALDAGRLASIRERRAAMLRSALPEAGSAGLLIDKNPSLLPLLTPYARLLSEPVIVMLRDPRDIVVSGLMVHLPLNEFSVDFLWLDAAVDRVESDLRSWLRVRDKLPSDAWIESRYEDLVRAPEHETARILARLGFDAGAAGGAGGGPVYSPSYAEVDRPVHTASAGRWTRYARYLEPHLERLEALARDLGSSGDAGARTPAVAVAGAHSAERR